MIDQNTDFFAYVDNFEKKAGIESICKFDKYIEKPLVTIGIPTFKRISTLKDALESALSQDCNFTFKILVLDNNPEREDETEVFMKKYEDNPIVSYYKNSKNLGMGGNWNRVISLARTEWVVLLHDDDLLLPSFLEEVMRIAETYNADIVNSGFYFWNDRQEKKPYIKKSKKKYPVIRSTLSSNYFIHRAGMPTGILYKKRVYIEEGGVNMEMYPALDYVFHTKLSAKYNFILYCKPLTIYRWSINESQNSHTIEGFLKKGYEFRNYLRRMAGIPQWFNIYYSNLLSRSFAKQIGHSVTLHILGKEMKFRPINKIDTLILVCINKAQLLYFNKKNLVGKE